jgi:hypothetical protein
MTTPASPDERARRSPQLLDRLAAIGRSLASSGEALALLGLGSVGVETNRLDAYSDLDFFAIVRPGAKGRFLKSLDWLAQPAPIVYAFQNTADGYKALYADGIFCEFAVFEPDEMRDIPFAQGRVVWQDAAFDVMLATPRPRHPSEHPIEWLLGEALTNLYVGLGRLRRGEVLSATRFIQGYAVDRVVDLTAHLEAPQPVDADAFSGERRFERRFPQTAVHLPRFVQGYARNVESARAILDFLGRHFEVNPQLREAILRLLADAHPDQ